MQPHCVKFRLICATTAIPWVQYQSAWQDQASYTPQRVAVTREAYRAQHHNKESSRSARDSPPAEQILVNMMEAVSNGQGCNACEHLAGM